jgi:hypothetical protein
MLFSLQLGRVRCLLAFSAVVALFVPTDAQKLSSVDLQRRRVERELLRSTLSEQGIDKRTLQLLRERFMGDGRTPWDRTTATDRIADAVAKQQLPAALFESSLKVRLADFERPIRLFPRDPSTVRSETEILELLGLTESPSSTLVKSSSSEQPDLESTRYAEARAVAELFVDRVAARLRLSTVLEEIGRPLGTKERDLGPAEMRDQLRTFDVPDVEAVIESFDFDIASVRFQRLAKPTTLLRLIGGTTPTLGRFFTCCALEDGVRRWSDASDLALPPGNRADRLVAVTIPAGTTICVGVIADNFADKFGRPLRGGNTQIFILERLRDVAIEYFERQLSPEGQHDFAVLQNDRLIRFRTAQTDRK